MSSGLYNQFKSDLMIEGHQLVNDTIKVALMGSGHSFNAANDNWSDVSANEISGSGYSAGGQALSNKTVTTDDVNNRGVFDADDVTWSNATITAYHAVLYNDTPTGDPLIGSIDFGGAVSVTNGNFKIIWDSAGVLYLG